jgi:excisionase family DNA binding protein
MHRRLQSVMRENPASDQRYGSRQAVSDPVDSACIVELDLSSRAPSRSTDQAEADIGGVQYAARPRAATGEREDNRLLTIQQVAELLHVPASWVYGRTRRRSTERLPGIRLGKYWRFREEEIHAWVENQRGGHRVP